MKQTNWTFLAVIPMMAALLMMACNSKTGVSDTQNDTILDSDTVVAEDVIPVDTTDTVYTRCDTIPQYEGGMQAFINATLNGLEFPEISSRYQCSGTYHIDLIVEKNGKVYNARLVKKQNVKIVVPDSVDRKVAMAQVDSANMAAILAIVKNGPACKPAMVNGQPVRFALRLPINMLLEPNPTQKAAK